MKVAVQTIHLLTTGLIIIFFKQWIENDVRRLISTREISIPILGISFHYGSLWIISGPVMGLLFTILAINLSADLRNIGRAKDNAMNNRNREILRMSQVLSRRGDAIIGLLEWTVRLALVVLPTIFNIIIIGGNFFSFSEMKIDAGIGMSL